MRVSLIFFVCSYKTSMRYKPFLVYLVEGRKFPPGFKFGAATASYQIEGAWNVSDKSESIWDVHVHTKPEKIADRSTGDIACDSYNQWRRDVEIAAELGLHFYRFSLSWTRLMPKGFSHYVSEDGKKYYSDLIDALLEKGIEPVVTLYHWDLPQSLQDLGGWTNPLIADWFADYARVVFTLYGDRVKTWLTINEPIMFCEVPYSIGIHPPGTRSPGVGNYLCGKHALLAHAKAWRIYDKEFRPKFNGKISFTNHMIWLEPENEQDEEIADLARQLMTGLYCHPVFTKEGGWPSSVEKIIAEKSKAEGRTQSKLPSFTEEEKELVKGTYDFFGMNLYTARRVRRAEKGERILPWPVFGSAELDLVLTVSKDWEKGASMWFYVYPEGLRNQLNWIKKTYGDVEIFITENGYSGLDESLEDHDRVNYYKRYLEQALLAIEEDGVNLTSYTAWTMIDNFEWHDGYHSKFGIYHVDFTDPKRTRTPRASALYYKRVIQAHAVVDVDNVEDNIISDEL